MEENAQVSVSLKVKIFDDSGTRVLQVSKSTLTIGSASHCDVVFEDPSVAPEHTRAWLEGGRIWVQDLGHPSGTALNDIRLPALKPMLVRELDVLRLGESKSTLGLEAILVRAPVVKPKASDTAAKDAAATADAKAYGVVDVEKRREDAQKVGRELADLRLQLQMARLEKNSADELTQQLDNLRDEVTRVHHQKEMWDDSLRQMENEKQKIREEVEQELTQFKTNALIELKKNSSAEFKAQMHSLKTELKEAQELNTRLQSENGVLRDDLAKQKNVQSTTEGSAKDQIRALQEQNRQLEKDIVELESQSQSSSTGIKKASEELRLARELSDRLQREKSEMRKNFDAELGELRSKRVSADGANHEEVKKLQTQNRELESKAQLAVADAKKLTDENKRLKTEAESMRRDLDKQIADIRSKSIKDLSAQMLHEAHKHENWKQDQLATFAKAVQGFARLKTRTWSAQGLPQDMVKEWEAEVMQIFRRVILNDSSPVTFKENERDAGAEASASRKEETKRKSPRRDLNLQRWKSLAFPSLMLVLVTLGLYFGFSFFRSIGSRSFSSTAATKIDVKPPPSSPHSRAQAHSPAQPSKVAANVLPARFEPKLSKKYRGSYAENVLYLENYVGIEEKPEFRRLWQNELNKVATGEWKIDSFALAPVTVEEQGLIKDLKAIRATITTTDREAEALTRMRAREDKFLHELEGIFKNKAGVDRFLKFKRAFYQRNQASLSRNK